jgi:hypothetical protein
MIMTASVFASGGSKHSRRNGATSVRVEKHEITPEKALRWLETNDNNRPVSPKRVQQLAKDMIDGVFAVTHQGIAFDSDGRLIDGQHRLWAVVESGVTISMFVCFGLDRSAVVHYIDDGRPRSMTDKLGYGGVSTDKRRVSIVRSMMLHYRRSRLHDAASDGSYTWNGSNDRVRAATFGVFHEAVRPAVEFSLSSGVRGGKSRLGHACVCAAVACAWYTQNHDRLAAFLALLASGEIGDRSDNAAIRLRDFMMNTDLAGGGEQARCEIFVRASTALRAFVERRPLSKLYAVPTAPFEIPDIAGFDF